MVEVWGTAERAVVAWAEGHASWVTSAVEDHRGGYHHDHGHHHDEHEHHDSDGENDAAGTQGGVFLSDLLAGVASIWSVHSFWSIHFGPFIWSIYLVHSFGPFIWSIQLVHSFGPFVRPSIR